MPDDPDGSDLYAYHCGISSPFVALAKLLFCAKPYAKISKELATIFHTLNIYSFFFIKRTRFKAAKYLVVSTGRNEGIRYVEYSLLFTGIIPSPVRWPRSISCSDWAAPNKIIKQYAKTCNRIFEEKLRNISILQACTPN